MITHDCIVDNKGNIYNILFGVDSSAMEPGVWYPTVQGGKIRLGNHEKEEARMTKEINSFNGDR